jgi:prepilin peptidase CpaA
LDFFIVLFLSVVVISAAVIDMRIQKIPNLLTCPAMAVALVYYLAVHGWDGLLFSAGGLMVGTAVFFVVYLMGWMGAGDAKLVGAVGAAVGIKGVIVASLLTAVIGGVYAVLLLLIRRRYCAGMIARWAATLKTFFLTAQFIPIPAPAGEDEQRPRLCYAIAIALGTILYVLLEMGGYSLI